MKPTSITLLVLICLSSNLTADARKHRTKKRKHNGPLEKMSSTKNLKPLDLIKNPIHNDELAKHRQLPYQVEPSKPAKPNRWAIFGTQTK